MQENIFNKNIETIKISIPYQQWMQYGEDNCRECRKNEYGDVYFVVDISFLLTIRNFNSPPSPPFSYIVNIMKESDKGNATMGDMSLYFDIESKHLFHDRELKDRSIILFLMPPFVADDFVVDELRDRIYSFTDTVALTPNILFMGHCGTKGHIVRLSKIKRIVELYMIEKGCGYMNAMMGVQEENDCSVSFATSLLNTPIVTFW